MVPGCTHVGHMRRPRRRRPRSCVSGIEWSGFPSATTDAIPMDGWTGRQDISVPAGPCDWCREVLLRCHGCIGSRRFREPVAAPRPVRAVRRPHVRQHLRRPHLRSLPPLPVPVPPGTMVEGRVDSRQLAATLADFTFDVLAGLRVWRLSNDVTASALNMSRSYGERFDWADPVVGARVPASLWKLVLAGAGGCGWIRRRCGLDMVRTGDRQLRHQRPLLAVRRVQGSRRRLQPRWPRI